ncbi:class I SAM-dependent methyltransferase [Xylocopilactobacillus apis]|uniref:DNA methyltransferase n=1 Tax=Xylocopilactobacillus apis TaxID=2932183 RepID=A0AAU9CR08_9LACO|nr:class I SAM-dependent methyltransferase [Xylocopilactobacillus apis]BDR56369.1 DNA methyltransferase [Xylocopilactobacillus apis]
MDNNILKNFNQIYKEFNFTDINEISNFVTDLNTSETTNPTIKKYNLNKLDLYNKQLLVESIIINVLVKNDPDFNHRLTPPSIGVIFSEIISVLIKKEPANIVDFGVGSGSLIFSILSNLKNGNINAFGVDNNEDFIHLAQNYRSLFNFRNSVDLIFDDVIGYEPLDKVDFVIGDLPVGYYPQKDNISDFKVKVSDDYTYVQNLFVEKSLKILKKNGFAIFAAPQNIFTSKQNGVLLNIIRENAFIQGIISLPLNSFVDKKFAKSIIILQKQGSSAKQINPVLIYEFQNIEDIKSYQKLFSIINAWSKEIKE